MATKPQFDTVLWGGSSFVGRLVAEHLHQTYGVDAQVRWAIGGRNQHKLEDTRSWLGAGAEELPIIVGDARDRQFLAAMVKNTNVVLTTVGPYALYGKELVEACAASGTDYCDLTGEIPFIQEMMDRHAVRARASGARILNCCGVDSLPSDLGVWALNEIAQKQFGCGLEHVTTEVKSFKGTFSGGTISSLGNMLNAAARNDKVASILGNPYAICPPDRRSGVTQPDTTAVRRSESGAWLGPFFMAVVNTRVVHATNAHLNYPYGTDFTYDEGWDVGGRLAASILALVSRAFYGAYRFGPIRAFLNATVLPKPGTGPSKNAGIRTLILALMRLAGGGWFALGFFTIVMALAALRTRSVLVRWTLPAGTLIAWSTSFAVTWEVYQGTGAATPWAPSLAMIGFAILAFVMDAPWYSNIPDENDSVAKDRTK